MNKIKHNNVLGRRAIERLIVPLWNGIAPGSFGHSENDIPTLTVYPAAKRKAGGRFELHIYGSGRHGLGLGIGLGGVPGEVQYHSWTNECGRWLKEQGFIK